MTTYSLQHAVDQIGKAAEAMGAIRTEYIQKVKAIKNDIRLSPTGQKQALDELYAEMKERHAKARANFVNTMNSEQGRLRDVAFGVSTEAQRNAVARAAATKTREELQNLYNLALTTSDSVLVSAVGAQAYMVGEWGMLNSIAERDAKVSDFVEFERHFGRLRTNDQKMEQNMLVSALIDPSGVTA